MLRKLLKLCKALVSVTECCKSRPIHHGSYLPNFSSSKSDGDRLGFRQSIANIPRFTVTQHRKSIMISKRRIPATAIRTIAIDETLILLSATPITSKPGRERKEFYRLVKFFSRKAH